MVTAVRTLHARAKGVTERETTTTTLGDLSNLRGAVKAQRNIARAAVEAAAKDYARAARRRINVDTGASKSSVGFETLSDTRAHVGATTPGGRFTELRNDRADQWLGPAAEAASAGGRFGGGRARGEEHHHGKARVNMLQRLRAAPTCLHVLRYAELRDWKTGELIRLIPYRVPVYRDRAEYDASRGR